VTCLGHHLRGKITRKFALPIILANFQGTGTEEYGQHNGRRLISLGSSPVGCSRFSSCDKDSQLSRLRKVFHRKQLSITFRYADAHGIHVPVQYVGAVLGRLHKALVNRGCVWSLINIFGEPTEVGPGRFRPRGQVQRMRSSLSTAASTRLRCLPSSHQKTDHLLATKTQPRAADAVFAPPDLHRLG
jgi:hypothetical protein